LRYVEINDANTLANVVWVDGCVGDALGVPVEFTTRQERGQIPVTTMLDYGTWNVPAGTWSDDSSLTLFTGYSLEAMPIHFVAGTIKLTGHPMVKYSTLAMLLYAVIMRWQQGLPLEQVGGRSENSNGNGALM